MKLNTEIDTPKMEKRISAAAGKYFRTRRHRTHFEHGQWWITLFNGAQFSVCDAEGGDSVDGFCFEQVSDGYEI